MRSRTASRLAWALWAASAALLVAAVVVNVLPAADPPRLELQAFVLGFVLLAFPTVGAIIASRQPRNPIGWLLCAAGLWEEIGVFALVYAVRSLVTAPGSLPGGDVAVWLQELTLGPSFFAFFIFLLLLFPDGRLLSRRWRPVMVVGLLAVAAVTFLVAVEPGPLEEAPVPAENPFGIDAAALRTLSNVFFALLLAVVVAAAASIVVRFRRSRGVERQQLKWFVSAGVVMVLVFVAVPFLFQTPLGPLTPIILTTVVSMIPVATGIAILRYRLYEIDRIISRTATYAIVTALLAGLYALVALVVPAFLFRTADTPDWLIAGATLLVAAVFVPVRRRVRNAVDRRFNRARYDAARTIEAFAARLREEVDIDLLGAELASMVDSTMQPAHVSLWIKPQKT